MAKKPHKKVQKPRKPMTKAQAKHLQRQAEQAAARRATNMTKTMAKHESIARKAAEAAGASEKVARDLAKGITGSKKDIRRQAEQALEKRKTDFVTQAENNKSQRSKLYSERADSLRRLLEADYWDLAEAAAAGRYEEARTHNIEYLERKLAAVEELRAKYEDELATLEDEEDIEAVEQLLRELDDKEDEINDVLYQLQHPVSSQYKGDPLAKYFKK